LKGPAPGVAIPVAAVRLLLQEIAFHRLDKS
jgi:hypothetical protein